MQKKNLEDSVLIKNYINGSEADFETLITKHQLFLFNVIQSKVHDKYLAEDIFQDTFIKVIGIIKRGNYKEEGKFLPWVLKISNNLIIDHYRKIKRMEKYKYTNIWDFDICSILTDETLNAEKKIIKEQDAIRVKELLELLPDEQRIVLVMRMQYGMSFKLISEDTGVSINTSLGRMRYGLQKLKKILEQTNWN